MDRKDVLVVEVKHVVHLQLSLDADRMIESRSICRDAVCPADAPQVLPVRLSTLPVLNVCVTTRDHREVLLRSSRLEGSSPLLPDRRLSIRAVAQMKRNHRIEDLRQGLADIVALRLYERKVEVE